MLLKALLFLGFVVLASAQTYTALKFSVNGDLSYEQVRDNQAKVIAALATTFSVDQSAVTIVSVSNNRRRLDATPDASEGYIRSQDRQLAATVTLMTTIYSSTSAAKTALTSALNTAWTTTFITQIAASTGVTLTSVSSISSSSACGSNTCTAGKYCTAFTNICSSCDAGTYTTASSVALTTLDTGGCTNCPSGKYSSVTGSTSCTSCPVGKSASLFLIGKTACGDCTDGTYASKVGSHNCTMCPADTYSNGPTFDSCINCPSGKTTYGFGYQSKASSCSDGLAKAVGLAIGAIIGIVIGVVSGVSLLVWFCCCRQKKEATPSSGKGCCATLFCCCPCCSAKQADPKFSSVEAHEVGVEVPNTK